jgi:hypothetical protein
VRIEKPRKWKEKCRERRGKTEKQLREKDAKSGKASIEERKWHGIHRVAL